MYITCKWLSKLSTRLSSSATLPKAEQALKWQLQHVERLLISYGQFKENNITYIVASLEHELFYLRDLIKVTLARGLRGKSNLAKESLLFVKKLAMIREREIAKLSSAEIMVNEARKNLTTSISKSYAAYR